MRRKQHSDNCWLGEPSPSFEMAGTVQFLMVNSTFSIAFLPCPNQEEMLILKVFTNQKIVSPCTHCCFLPSKKNNPKNLYVESNLFTLTISKYFIWILNTLRILSPLHIYVARKRKNCYKPKKQSI